MSALLTTYPVWLPLKSHGGYRQLVELTADEIRERQFYEMTADQKEIHLLKQRMDALERKVERMLEK